MVSMVFRKTMKGLTGILGVGAVALGMSGQVSGREIKIMNTTSNTSIGVSTLYCKNISGASEGYDESDLFFNPPFPPSLEVFTEVGGYRLGVDARPVDTSGWDFVLGVLGNVTCDNTLKFKVTDTADLENKYVYTFDIANPSTIYHIPKDGSIYNIDLPDLVAAKSVEEYAFWRLGLQDYIPGDANLDGIVDDKDASILGLNWQMPSGAEWINGDFNDDYAVNDKDAAILAAHYGQSVESVESAGTNIPEPSTLELLIGLGIGGGLGFSRRKR